MLDGRTVNFAFQFGFLFHFQIEEFVIRFFDKYYDFVQLRVVRKHILESNLACVGGAGSKLYKDKGLNSKNKNPGSFPAVQASWQKAGAATQGRENMTRKKEKGKTPSTTATIGRVDPTQSYVRMDLSNYF